MKLGGVCFTPHERAGQHMGERCCTFRCPATGPRCDKCSVQRQTTTTAGASRSTGGMVALRLMPVGCPKRNLPTFPLQPRLLLLLRGQHRLLTTPDPPQTARLAGRCPPAAVQGRLTMWSFRAAPSFTSGFLNLRWHGRWRPRRSSGGMQRC